MPKTQEELEEYIHNYKSKELENVNSSTQKLNDLANSVDLQLGSQLLTLGSALLVVIGGFILSQGAIDDNGVKVIIIMTMISLLSSLVAGLKNLHDISSFWSKNAKHKHKEGRIILEDTSKSYEDLVTFRAKLIRHRDDEISTSETLARNIQIGAFGIGIGLLFVLTTIKVFSA